MKRKRDENENSDSKLSKRIKHLEQELILARKAEKVISSANSKAYDAFYELIQEKELGVFEYILRNPEHFDFDEDDVISHALMTICNDGDVELLDYFVSQKKLICLEDNFSWEHEDFCTTAIEKGKIDIFRYLLEHGNNYIYDHGIDFACNFRQYNQKFRLEAVEVYFNYLNSEKYKSQYSNDERKAEVNYILYKASEDNYPEIIELCFKNGATIDGQIIKNTDTNGASILDYALENNDNELIISMVLKYAHNHMENPNNCGKALAELMSLYMQAEDIKDNQTITNNSSISNSDPINNTNDHSTDITGNSSNTHHDIV